jgi:hypothetical protein
MEEETILMNRVRGREEDSRRRGSIDAAKFWRLQWNEFFQIVGLDCNIEDASGVMSRSRSRGLKCG